MMVSSHRTGFTHQFMLTTCLPTVCTAWRWVLRFPGSGRTCLEVRARSSARPDSRLPAPARSRDSPGLLLAEAWREKVSPACSWGRGLNRVPELVCGVKV